MIMTRSLRRSHCLSEKVRVLIHYRVAPSPPLDVTSLFSSMSKQVVDPLIRPKFPSIYVCPLRQLEP